MFNPASQILVGFGLLLIAGSLNAQTTRQEPSLHQSLAALGWQVGLTEDGATLLVPLQQPQPELPGSGIRQPSGTGQGSRTSSAPPPGSTLKAAALEQLRTTGWRVDTDASGSILLYPPGESPSPADATESRELQTETEPVPSKTRRSLYENLSSLRALGWRAETYASGVTLLYPPPMEVPGDRTSSPGPAGIEPESGPPLGKGRFSISEGDLDRLRKEGWQTVDDGSDTSLLSSPLAETTTRAAGRAVAGDLAPGEPQALDRLAELLAQRGWAVARDVDGGLLLRARVPQSATGSHRDEAVAAGRREHGESLLIDCPGTAPPTTGADAVPLPIDTWSKARRIAQTWVDSVQLQKASVGRVRRIHRIFIISIVDSAPPHRLKHQIGVRVSDGSVLVLN